MAGRGNDLLVTGAGVYVVTGGEGIDMLQIAGSAGVTVNLALGTVQSLAGGGSVRLSGIESVQGTTGADRLTGNAHANTLQGGAGPAVLSGGAGADVLIGGDGADRLIGDAGNDGLTGGAGADRFVFMRGSGRDRIADFQNGLDQIEIVSGAESFADLRIADAGADVVVSYGADHILLATIDHRLIDAGDFLFT